jgi:hypothetical protein
MLTTVVTAAALNPDFGLNGQTVGDWMVNNVVYIGIIIVAITIITAAVTKKPRDAFTAFAITLLAFLLIALAGSWQEIGDWFKNTFLNG